MISSDPMQLYHRALGIIWPSEDDLPWD